MLDEELKKNENQDRLKCCLDSIVNYIGERLYPYIIAAVLTIITLILMTGLTVFKVFRS